MMEILRSYKAAWAKAKVLLLMAAFVFSGFAGGPEGNEYQIKAMFIFNFTKYVEWPEGKSKDIFTIGVIGESDITEPLERIAQQKKVGDKKIVIKKLSLDDEEYCNIILVSKSRYNKLDQVEKKYTGKGVLIITDEAPRSVGSSRVDLQACKLEYSIVSPK